MKHLTGRIFILGLLLTADCVQTMEKPPQQNAQTSAATPVAATSAPQGPVSRVRMTRSGQVASVDTIPAPQPQPQQSYSEAFTPIPVPANSGSGALPVVESKRSVSPDGTKMPLPVTNPAQKQSSSRKFEFSNQSNHMAAVWIPKDARSWLPITLTPEKDSGMVTPFEGGTIYIYTNAGFFVMMVQNGVLKLVKETTNAAGQVKPELIKSLEYAQATDLLVIINPNGSVDFSKRNR